jgi:hypothetical protein
LALCISMSLKDLYFYFIFSFFFLVGLRFELRASLLQSSLCTLAKQVLSCLSHTYSPFCSGYFGDGRVSRTICPYWPRTVILLISASQVAKITGVNHRCLASGRVSKLLSLSLCENMCVCLNFQNANIDIWKMLNQ